LRRWLRSGKLRGVKVGSDWRVNAVDLEPFLNPGRKDGIAKTGDSQPKMCFRFPKWLEFSGLPTSLNQKYGPETWPVLKKLIELDFELGKPDDRRIRLDIAELAERAGYTEEKVKQVLAILANAGFIKYTEDAGTYCLVIVTPIKTPKLILDISYEKGGIKGAPTQALTNSCLRRFLESGDHS
jgi:hypothetical protein